MAGCTTNACCDDSDADLDKADYNRLASYITGSY